MALGESCLEPFRNYLAAHFGDDAHVDGTVLYRELAELEFDRSYVTFVRELRRLALRPRCEACRTGGHGVTTVIAHKPGEEIQWDWLELTQTPWGESAPCAGRRARVVREGACGDLRGRELPASGGGNRRGAAPPGRDDAGVADGQDGHGRASRLGSHHRPVRAAR